MAMLGSSWKEEESNEDKYFSITGKLIDKEELMPEIEKDLQSNFTSKTERNELQDLLQKINQEENT